MFSPYMSDTCCIYLLGSGCAVPACNSLPNIVCVLETTIRQRECGLPFNSDRGSFPASLLFLSLVCKILNRTPLRIVYDVVLSSGSHIHCFSGNRLMLNND